VETRELECRLDRLGPGVGEQDLRVARPGPHRGDHRHLLGQLDRVFVVEVGGRHVEEPAGLIGDRRGHLGVAVAGGADRDACGEVEEAVAVRVDDAGPLAALDDERVGARVGG
jgi:hypothetical protein